MRDPRLEKLADILVNYSVEVKKGHVVRISCDPVAMPLVEEIYAKVLQAGGHPVFRAAPGVLQDIFFEYAEDHQLDYLNPMVLEEVEKIDASIGMWADVNTKSLSNVDPARQARASAAVRPYKKRFMERYAEGGLKWVGTQYPTEASAQDAEMSLREYEDFVFSAGALDLDDPVGYWKQIAKGHALMEAFLTGKKELRYEADNGTDVTFNISDMSWVGCNGECNFPDGEIFTGPNLKAPDGGVNGKIRYSFPAVYRGREVDGIELTFEKGKVVKATAEKNEKYLIEMLDQDEGARYVGEVAIGTNYQIQQYTRNTLFDEKIGGTVHVAVGAGYPETGNTNDSGLHWDMVCDMRTGGRITVDGHVISENGKFKFEGWPGID